MAIFDVHQHEILLFVGAHIKLLRFVYYNYDYEWLHSYAIFGILLAWENPNEMVAISFAQSESVEMKMNGFHPEAT